MDWGTEGGGEENGQGAFDILLLLCRSQNTSEL